MKISKTLKLLFIFLPVFILSSCLKEKEIALDYSTIQLPVNLNINKILFENDSTIWVACGKKYGDGAVFLSTDKGSNWSQVLTLDQEFKDLDFKDSVIYAFPVGNTIYKSYDRGQNWQVNTMPGWEFFSAGLVNSENSVLLVGGEGFGKGIMHGLNPGYNPALFLVDTVGHELCDIEIVKDSILVTVGYGIVLRSTDNGNFWIPNNVRGDFYRAVTFPTQQNGYVVGDFGSLLKTDNAGQSWTTLKDGSTLFNENERFNDIHFIDEDHGVISGRNGLLWITHNAAKTWAPVNNLPKYNYGSALMREDKIYLGGENGQILVVERP
jgi:photosystem II stability/assembly factor-like uncharacterized protein